jgi:hypothetical protein
MRTLTMRSLQTAQLQEDVKEGNESATWMARWTLTSFRKRLKAESAATR